jgi:hypothetical protein
MDTEKIQTEIAKIQKILVDHPGGEPNETARRLVKIHLGAIFRAAPDEGYVREKASDILVVIDRYYSARKHLKYRQDFTSGVEVLRGQIESLLGRIESWHGWKDNPSLPDKS